ncbi:unnamed protein product, partial [Didymodactylos carnosus]
NLTCSTDNCILQFSSTELVDRVVIREDLRSSTGASIRQWSIDGFMMWGDCMNCWIEIPSAKGRSVGSKRIVLFGEAVLVQAIRLNIYKAVGDRSSLAQFDAYLCQQ